MKKILNISRLIIYIYKYILPAFILICLLGVSQFILRPWIMGSLIIDFLVRVWLGFSFQYIYKTLSDLDSRTDLLHLKRSSYSTPRFPVIIWQNVMYGGILFLISIPFSILIVKVFFPPLANIAWEIALLHGFLLFLPFLNR